MSDWDIIKTLRNEDIVCLCNLADQEGVSLASLVERLLNN